MKDIMGINVSFLELFIMGIVGIIAILCVVSMAFFKNESAAIQSILLLCMGYFTGKIERFGVKGVQQYKTRVNANGSVVTEEIVAPDATVDGSTDGKNPVG